MKTINAFTLAFLVASVSVESFLSSGKICRASQPEKATSLFVDVGSSSTFLAERDYGEAIKSITIILALGGGLIPATISANKSMLETLKGKKARTDVEGDVVDESESFDPTITDKKYRTYVADSGATGPTLPFASLLLSSDRIPLADVVAVLGRIQNVDSVADWSNLPSTKLPKVSAENPPQWLPRQAFKVNIRKAKFNGWPTDPKTGEPLGGEVLKTAELGRVSKQGALIGDAALDVVFDTWAWGAAIATPDKVSNTLEIYRKKANEVDLGAFVAAALRGRSTAILAAITFVVIQLVAYGILFVEPALKFIAGE